MRRTWRAKPTAFVKDQLGLNLWSKQNDILLAVRDHHRVAVRSCNGSGKTFAAATAVIWWITAYPDSVAITTAPTNHQVRDLLWREIARIHRKNSDLIGGTLTKTALEIGDRNFALGLSTDAPERFQGFHEGNILFVVDEASGVSEEIYEAIEGCLTSERARLLLIGNPTRRAGTFYRAFQEERELWYPLHISALETPNLIGERTGNSLLQETETKSGSVTGATIMPGLVTARWVEEAGRKWGAKSPTYQIRVLGEFPSQSIDTLFGLETVEAAVQKASSASGGTQGFADGPAELSPDAIGPFEVNPDANDPLVSPVGAHGRAPLPNNAAGPVFLGVDVARYGSDNTAICIRYGDTVASLETYPKQSTMETAGRIAAAINEHNPTAVRIDEIGVGAGVVDRLKELGLDCIEGVNVANKANDPKTYANLRAEIYDGLRERFEREQIFIPDDAALISQLTSIRYTFTSNGQIKIEDKESLRRQGLPSPDLVDALVLAFAPVYNDYRIFTGADSYGTDENGTRLPTSCDLCGPNPDWQGEGFCVHTAPPRKTTLTLEEWAMKLVPRR